MNNKQRLKLSIGATATLKRAKVYFDAVASGNALKHYTTLYNSECLETAQLRHDLGLKAVQDLQDLGFTFEDVKTLVKMMDV